MKISGRGGSPSPHKPEPKIEHHRSEQAARQLARHLDKPASHSGTGSGSHSDRFSQSGSGSHTGTVSPQSLWRDSFDCNTIDINYKGNTVKGGTT